ncbi:MAG: lipopolysaccharide biosynthesis protein [Candidatus Methylacidiphilales bacterium]
MINPVSAPEIIPPLHRKTVGTVLNIFLLRCFSLLLANVLYFVIERFYGTGAVGSFGIYFSFISIGGLLASYGFGNAVLKLSGAASGDRDLAMLGHGYRKMLRLTSFTATGIALIIVLLGRDLAAIFLKDPNLAPVFYGSAMVLLPYCLLDISSEVIRGRGKTNLYIIFKETGLWVVAAPVLVFLIMTHYGPFSPVIAHALAVVVFAVVALMVCQELLRTEREWAVTGSTLKELLKLSVPMQLSKGLNWTAHWIDILIMGVFLGAPQIGIYMVLNRLAAFADQVSYSINVYVAPRIAYHHQQQRGKHLSQLTRDSVRYGTLTVIPLALLLAIICQPLLSWYGADYASAWIAFLILLLSGLIDTACGPVGYLLNMTGKEQSSVHIMVTTTLLRVIFLLVFVGYLQWGLLGAALAHLLFVVVWNLVSLVVIRQHLGFLPVYIPTFKKN